MSALMQPVVPCETPSGPQSATPPASANDSAGTTDFLEVLLSLCKAAGESVSTAVVAAESAQPAESSARPGKVSKQTSDESADSAVDSGDASGAMNTTPLAAAASIPVLPQIIAATPINSEPKDAPKQVTPDVKDAPKPVTPEASAGKASMEISAAPAPAPAPEVLSPQPDALPDGAASAMPSTPLAAAPQASPETVAKLATSPRTEIASFPESAIAKQPPAQSAEAPTPASAPTSLAATKHNSQSDDTKQESQKPNFVLPAQQRAIPSGDSNSQVQPDAKPAQAEIPHRTGAQTGVPAPTQHKQSTDVSPQSQPNHVSADASQVQTTNVEPVTAHTSAVERVPDAAPAPAHSANMPSSADTAPKDPASSSRPADAFAQPASRAADPATLVQNARLIQSIDTTEMRVAVNTPDLGRLEIHTTQHGDTVGAAIRVEHADTQRVMSAEAPTLERTLAQHHVELRGISLLDMQSGNNSRHANAWEPPSSPSRIPREESQTSTDASLANVPAAPVWSRSLNLLA